MISKDEIRTTLGDIGFYYAKVIYYGCKSAAINVQPRLVRQRREKDEREARLFATPSNRIGDAFC